MKAMAMKAAMKAMKTMKKAAMKKAAMKAMKKAMKVSAIAKGPRARASVFTGGKEKTYTGIKKSDLMKNSRGRLVTKKSHKAGVKSYKHISKWGEATQKARKELGIKGFCPMGGKTAQGKALYAKTKSIYSS
mmetsp:Transcript_19790/g.34666  ORF Transcript_19790/g.34666 Transcript_19790/m.34666 type:complete len:132 (+) Transcript_19790:2-397(+)